MRSDFPASALVTDGRLESGTEVNVWVEGGDFMNEETNQVVFYPPKCFRFKVLVLSVHHTGFILVKYGRYVPDKKARVYQDFDLTEADQKSGEVMPLILNYDGSVPAGPSWLHLLNESRKGPWYVHKSQLRLPDEDWNCQTMVPLEEVRRPPRRAPDSGKKKKKKKKNDKEKKKKKNKKGRK
jgi:hypothetical protein